MDRKRDGGQIGFGQLVGVIPFDGAVCTFERIADLLVVQQALVDKRFAERGDDHDHAFELKICGIHNVLQWVASRHARA